MASRSESKLIAGVIALVVALALGKLGYDAEYDGSMVVYMAGRMAAFPTDDAIRTRNLYYLGSGIFGATGAILLFSGWRTRHKN